MVSFLSWVNLLTQNKGARKWVIIEIIGTRTPHVPHPSIYACMHARMHAHTHTHTKKAHTHTHMHHTQITQITCTCTHTHTHTQKHTHKCTHSCTCMDTHGHAWTRTHAHPLNKNLLKNPTNHTHSKNPQITHIKNTLQITYTQKNHQRYKYKYKTVDPLFF